MKTTFKEYHQFTEQEFQQLWKNCLFVFDTNTLLNMYRYSRKTVDIYFKVLKELKSKRQLWIPYQVGYEFYENRIDVISEYESSYDSILSILNKAKNDIEVKYKNHPFLDLCELKKQMETGLSKVEKQIKEAKAKHPKWMNSDDVLDQIDQLFEDSIGTNYNEEKLNALKKEGKERYEKKIPPGYKDDKKTESKKYGDLILWYQVIDKAKESKKPIVLISGDIKEDWWLEKDGKKIMPLPQLKKEMLDKAKVDFHIYTADRFLEYYTNGQEINIDKTAISEVRKIRELEEKRMIMKRMEMIEKEREIDPRLTERYSVEYLHQFELLEDLMMRINESEIHPRHKEELDHLYRKIRELYNRMRHGEVDRMSIDRFQRYTNIILSVFEKLIHTEELQPELSMRIKNYLDRLERLDHRLINFI